MNQPKQNELLTHDGQKEENHQNAKKCHLCDKGFNFLHKKISCSHCENFFCIDHCCKEIASMEGQKIICDMCYHKFRREKLQAKVSEEIDLLNQELIRVKDASKRVERELFDKTAELNQLENKFGIIEKETLKNKKKHEREIEEYQEKIAILEKNNENIDIDIKKYNQELTDSNKTYGDKDLKLEETKLNIEMVKNIKSELSEQLLHVREKIKYCLDYPRTSDYLCPKCKDGLAKAYSERVNAEPQSLEESSMSLSESMSILDSVREMKESLNDLIVEPEHQAKCIVI